MQLKRYVLVVFAFCFVPAILKSQTDSVLYKLLQKLPNDTVLKFETFDGSGQLVHPDILFVNNNSDKAFYLVATPYPNFDNKNENPSIYKSLDGINFFEPVKSINPLVPTPVYGHNDDPDMWFNSIANVFNIQYLETMRPDSQNLVLLSGKPGEIWEKKTLIHYNLKKGEKFIVSPSIINENNSSKILFYVAKDYDKKGHNRVEYLVCKKKKWKKKKHVVPEIETPAGFTPWHVDVVKSGEKFYMLLDGFWGNEPVWGEKDINKYTLLLATTNDINKWTVSPVNIVDCTGAPDKECRYIYRSTSMVSGNIMAIWYSYVTFENVWRIAFRKVLLTN